MFGNLGKFIEQVVASATGTEATAFLDELLTNRKAFAFARERLRERFEHRVQPASYDNVMENLRVQKQDFIDYFRANPKGTLSGLQDAIRSHLRDRASGWIHNRPSEDLFDVLVEDFFHEYFRFFVTADPMLTTLTVYGATEEILKIVNDLQSEIRRIGELTGSQRATFDPSFPADVEALIRVLEVPFEVIELTDRYVDLKIVDPSAMFPSTVLVTAETGPLDENIISDVVQRRNSYGQFSRHVVLSRDASSKELAQFASNRSLDLLSVADFRTALLKQSHEAQYVFGKLALDELLRTLEIEGTYVDPGVLSVSEGARETMKWFPRIEEPPTDDPYGALSVAREFLRNPNYRVLLVMGDYGSGKTCFCAKLALNTISYLERGVAVMVPLNRVSDASALPQIVSRASHIAKSIYHEDARSVVICDGIDELPNAMDPNERRKNLLRLMKASDAADKLVVTCRASYFRGMPELWSLFAQGDANDLWTKFASHIVQENAGQRISIARLREFDNRKIDRFLSTYAEVRQEEPGFVERFNGELETVDPDCVFRRLARNPLYLNLMVKVRPWADPSVSCLADVIRLLIKFWLERDCAKGESRWLLGTDDRFDFLYDLAWWMFEKNRVTLSFREFGTFLDGYQVNSTIPPEMYKLDLQTTGCFTHTGDLMHFVLPAFLDYLVALRFLEFDFHSPLMRPPTLSQLHLLLGLYRTDNRGLSFSYESIVEGAYTDGCSEDQLLAPVEIPSAGLLYRDLGSGDSDPWERLNRDRQAGLRRIVNASIVRSALVPENSICLMLANKFGLHARPCSMVLKAANWFSHHVDRSDARIYFEHCGTVVSTTSIVSLLTMAVQGGATINVLFENCSREDVERHFLAQIPSIPAEEGDAFDWKTAFHEKL